VSPICGGALYMHCLNHGPLAPCAVPLVPCVVPLVPCVVPLVPGVVPLVPLCTTRTVAPERPPTREQCPSAYAKIGRRAARHASTLPLNPPAHAPERPKAGPRAEAGPYIYTPSWPWREFLRTPYAKQDNPLPLQVPPSAAEVAHAGSPTGPCTPGPTVWSVCGCGGLGWAQCTALDAH
jgi:hypothetical protein